MSGETLCVVGLVKNKRQDDLRNTRLRNYLKMRGHAKFLLMGFCLCAELVSPSSYAAEKKRAAKASPKQAETCYSQGVFDQKFAQNPDADLIMSYMSNEKGFKSKFSPRFAYLIHEKGEKYVYYLHKVGNQYCMIASGKQSSYTWTDYMTSFRGYKTTCDEISYVINYRVALWQDDGPLQLIYTHMGLNLMIIGADKKAAAERWTPAEKAQYVRELEDELKKYPTLNCGLDKPAIVDFYHYYHGDDYIERNPVEMNFTFADEKTGIKYLFFMSQRPTIQRAGRDLYSYKIMPNNFVKANEAGWQIEFNPWFAGN